MNENRIVGRWATYLLVLLMPMSVYWPIGHSTAPWALDMFARPVLYLSDLAVGLLLLSSLTRLTQKSDQSSHPYLLPLLVMTGSAILTLPSAFLPTLAIYTVVRWLMAVGVYLALIRSHIPVAQLVHVFLAGLGLQVVVGLGQVLKHGPLGLPGELALQPWQPDVAVITAGGKVGIPAYGLSLNPNVLGGFLFVGLLLGLPLVGRRGFRLMWWLTWIGLVLTFSRSAWLATLILMPFAVGWLTWKRSSLRHSMMVASIGAMVVISVTALLCAEQMAKSLNPIVQSVQLVVDHLSLSTAQSSQATTPVAERSQLPTLDTDHSIVRTTRPPELNLITTTNLPHRIELWKVAIGIIADRPLTGIGAGNYPITVPFISESLRPNHAHNVPLQLAAEVGVLGGAAWLWMWLASAGVLFRRWSSLNAWAVVSICAWLGLGLISLYDGYPWVIDSGRLLTVTVLSIVSRSMEGGQD